MKLFEMQNSRTVYPVDNFQFWVSRWGISPKQLNEAIIETGSISVDEIKEHLIQKGVLRSFRRFRVCLNFIQKNTVDAFTHISTGLNMAMRAVK